MLSSAPWVYFSLTCLVILFQLGLAVGLPWGSVAMGGKYPGKFPHHMRGAAVVQALILAALAATVLTRADVIFPQWLATSRILTWFVVAFGIISVVLNLTTPSKWERRIWGPVTVLMLLSSLAVAID
ncbi:MAG: hypothetical protein JJE47_14250 [Acidimicrobiia bacterium]|nr:hypothetical protein [Acidimicrobiia bacterium]